MLFQFFEKGSHISHSHKKPKDSLETRAEFSSNLILTWNFRGGPSHSASVSEAVEKIPADEKDYRNAPLYVLLCTATAYKQHTNI